MAQVMAGEKFSLNLEIANIADFAQPVMIQSRALSFGEIRRAFAALGLSREHEIQLAQAQLPLNFTLAEIRTFVPGATTAYAHRLLGAIRAVQRRSEEVLCLPYSTIIAEPILHPGESCQFQLEVALPSNARTGEVYGFEFTQRLGNVITGGYTLYIVVAERNG